MTFTPPYRYTTLAFVFLLLPACSSNDQHDSVSKSGSIEEKYYRLLSDAAAKLNPAIEKNHGNITRDMPEVREAIDLYNKAIALEPEDNYVGLSRRADLYRAVGMYEEAILDLDRIVNLKISLSAVDLATDPTGNRHYKERGDCHRQLGHIAEAIADYQRAQALLELGECYLSQNEWKSAMETYRSAIDEYEPRTQSLDMNARTEFSDNFSRLIAAYYGLSVSQWNLGEYPNAADTISRCIELLPSEPKFFEHRAQCYDRLDMPHEAEEDRKKATSLIERDS